LVISWPKDLFSDARGKIERLAIFVRKEKPPNDENNQSGFTSEELPALSWASSKQGTENWYRINISSLRKNLNILRELKMKKFNNNNNLRKIPLI